VELRVLTLNCWGLGFGISKARDERMEDIGKWLGQQQFDIVFLEELWKAANFETMKQLVEQVLPNSHYFNNGVIGTGTAVFTKAEIVEATFHEFSLNGYPHKLMHGDWFGGKGLGVCQVDYGGLRINLFVSHFHANYNPLSDQYRGHRTVQAVEAAQWIKLASASADLTLYAGDFNVRPDEIPYQVVRHLVPLRDCWVEVNGEAGGETSETPGNSWTARSSLRQHPAGQRIDYILYRAGPNMTCHTMQCGLALPDRVPGKEISYSDHEAVAATLLVTRAASTQYAGEFSRVRSMTGIDTKVPVLRKSKGELEEHIKQVNRQKIIFVVALLICLMLALAAFITPQMFLDDQIYLGLDILLFLCRFFLVVLATYFFLMVTVFFRKERRTIRSTLDTVELLLQRALAQKVGLGAGQQEEEEGRIGMEEKDFIEKNP